MRRLVLIFILLPLLYGCRTNESKVSSVKDSTNVALYQEKHRPQIHFSPKQKWMNDPNGMVFFNGDYHLFYQHYPEDKVWGPMHWGHAVSKDLVHWTHLPIALYPDSLGLIFSGSAVVDNNNSSGFGSDENPPLVAIYTYHHMEKEKAGATDYQNQGIAFSLDSGKTWTKYANNPVLKNQGIKDFRDPKVFWHEETKKWIMSLAVLDHIEFWSSADLKTWIKLGEFGKNYAAHGGVWECPDLFKLDVEGENKQKWVLFVSINPGGPNGGSATQYFVGDFDGKTFKADTPKDFTAWLDYGPDNYAGVTWNNVPNDRKIFLGWMSNWAYGQEVPTDPWRSAMTCPRDMILSKVYGKYFIKSSVSQEYYIQGIDVPMPATLSVDSSLNLSKNGAGDISLSYLNFTVDAKDFTIRLANDVNQSISIAFDAATHEFTIDRSASGKNDFSKNYILKAKSPRISRSEKIKVSMVVDVSSVEIFFDDGLTVMTSVFFPDEVFRDLILESKQPLRVNDIRVKKLSSIW